MKVSRPGGGFRVFLPSRRNKELCYTELSEERLGVCQMRNATNNRKTDGGEERRNVSRVF